MVCFVSFAVMLTCVRPTLAPKNSSAWKRSRLDHIYAPGKACVPTTAKATNIHKEIVQFELDQACHDSDSSTSLLIPLHPEKVSCIQLRPAWPQPSTYVGAPNPVLSSGTPKHTAEAPLSIVSPPRVSPRTRSAVRLNGREKANVSEVLSQRRVDRH